MLSTNNAGSKIFDAFQRSLMYIRNNKDPSVEPCGTPHVTLSKAAYVAVSNILFVPSEEVLRPV